MEFFLGFGRSLWWFSGRLFVLYFILLAASGCEPGRPAITGKAYYVDCARGKDTNSGASASQAWGSLEKVDTTTFAAGDGIFIRRGTTCRGSLWPKGSGKEGAPILLAAYGSGQAPVIDGGAQEEALKLFDQEYWQVQDLETTGGTRYGVFISGSDTQRLHSIHLQNLTVHDVTGGVMDDKTTGLVIVKGQAFDDVLIEGVTAYNTTLWGGIEIVGGKERTTQAVIRSSTVHNVYGDGIVLWQVEKGLIEKSVAHDTGLQPPPKTIGTPSSIWTWSCYDCTVQYNESYRAFSPEVDGGCYDIDWGTKNNVYQYNYGHDCSGYCISVFGAGGLTTENAVVRYNMCANNGRSDALAARQGDIYLSTWDAGHLDGVLIYNNTFYWDPENNYSAMVNQADFSGSRPNLFANNILVSTSSWLIDSNAGLKLDYNLYWYAGEKPLIWTYGKDIYTGLPDFQKSGQEAHAIFADPQLKDASYHTVGAPKPGEGLSLLPGSPAIDAGLDLGEMGGRDFFGLAVPQGKGYDIGACEWK